MGLATFLGTDLAPTRLRGLLWLSLTDTGRISTRTATSDSGGGATEVWASGSDIPCRIDPIRGNELLAADRISDRATHLITTPAGTVVSTDGRFVIDGRGTYEITAVRERTGQAAQLFEAVQVS